MAKEDHSRKPIFPAIAVVAVVVVVLVIYFAPLPPHSGAVSEKSAGNVLGVNFTQYSKSNQSGPAYSAPGGVPMDN